MRIRPLNDYLILEMEENSVWTTNAEIERIFNAKVIELPQVNSLVKVSPYGKVLRAGPKCFYSFKKGQRVYIDHNLSKSSPNWYYENNKRYRIVQESDLAWVEENDAP